MPLNPTAERTDERRPTNLAWFVGHWRPYRRVLVPLVLLTLANAALLMVYPWMLNKIVTGIKADLPAQDIWWYALIVLLVGLGHFGVYSSLQTLRTMMNMRFEFSIRLRAFENVLRLGTSLFRRFRTADVVTRLLDDVNDKLSVYMCSISLRVLEAGSLVGFAIAMMLVISPRLTLYTITPLPVLVLLFVITASALHRRYAESQRSISHLNETLESCFSGIRLVKSLVAEKAQAAAIDAAIEKQRRAEVRAVRWQTVIDTLYSNIWQLAIVAVLLVGGRMVIDGELTLGEIVAFDAYVMLTVFPMFDIGQFLVRSRLSAVSIGRITELETAPPGEMLADPEPAPTRRPADSIPADYPAPRERLRAPQLRFENVSFRYNELPPGDHSHATSSNIPPGATPHSTGTGVFQAASSAGGAAVSTISPDVDDPVESVESGSHDKYDISGVDFNRHEFNKHEFAKHRDVAGTVTSRRASLVNVSLTAAAGRCTAIVGEIGCGKSTLMMMLPRLLEPLTGKIFIDGREVRDFEVVSLRQSIGYVPQEPQLLSGTIRENIRFGREWVSEEDVAWSADAAGLTPDLQQWPERLDRQVGVRGMQLSGGQRQRVALARALAPRPGILLLDDCAASLDAQTEEHVWRHILRGLTDCTVLLVTHRPATLQQVDSIVVLDQGHVREVGKFQQLNRPGSLFHDLYIRWLHDERTLP